MEHNHKDAIEELNDLVEIQNDRIRGYERAIQESKNATLSAAFTEMLQKSTRHRNELREHIIEMGGEVRVGTTVSGKLYRAWMDVKATFTGNDSENILESCIFGEQAAQKAYDMALESNDLTAECIPLVTKQQGELRADLEKVKALENIHD